MFKYGFVVGVIAGFLIAVALSVGLALFAEHLDRKEPPKMRIYKSGQCAVVKPVNASAWDSYLCKLT